MAAPITITKSKDHRKRKNSHSAEVFAQKRHEQNAKRPKQHWVGGESVAAGGYWTRETA